jgi:hypothetical protein
MSRYLLHTVVMLSCTCLPGAGGVAAQAGVPRTSVASADAEIYLAPLAWRDGYPAVGAPLNVTRRSGYDNQPSFAPDSRSLLFTSNRGDGHTDIYRFDLATGLTIAARATVPESEYSATLAADGKSMVVIRVEADSTQRLWRLALDGSADVPLFPDIKPVGYYAQADDSTWAMFVLGAPATLQVGRTARPGTSTLARNIGRSLHRIPGTSRVSYVQKGGEQWWVMSLDPATGRIDTLVATRPRSEDIAWVDSATLISGQGAKLYAWRRGDRDWREVADFTFAAMDNISRLAVAPSGAMIAVVAEAQARTRPAGLTPRADERVDPASVTRGMELLAGDAMMGRRTGTPGADRAAEWIATQFRQAGLAPAGDSGTYLQWMPITAAQPPAASSPNSVRALPVASWSIWDTLPPDRKLRTANVAGMIRGSDPALRDEVVLVTAHYDHLGVGRAVDGDSIYNGADDDASGTIALIEMARRLREGPRPKRTILFVAMTGEEVGLIGTRWYLNHPLLPLERTVANLNVEMIGLPDSLAGGFGKAWLTGYERSTMGDLLADNDIPLVPDLRLAQNFFRRSDNYAFAVAGIPAHTISSFGGHPQYHTPKDEPGIIDATHMARVIGATTRALRLLADGPRPAWHPGGRPEPAPARPR